MGHEHNQLGAGSFFWTAADPQHDTDQWWTHYLNLHAQHMQAAQLRQWAEYQAVQRANAQAEPPPPDDSQTIVLDEHDYHEVPTPKAIEHKE